MIEFEGVKYGVTNYAGISFLVVMGIAVVIACYVDWRANRTF